MIVVSNTGPLIALAKLGRLDIVQNLFSTVQIPPMVHRELMGRIGEEWAVIERGLQSFVLPVPLPVTPQEAFHALHSVDEGERQAISLAIISGTETLLLLDDKAGRTTAKQLGVRVTGTVGLLLLAKERGLITSVRESLLLLRAVGYWLSDDIIATAIKMAGEDAL